MDWSRFVAALEARGVAFESVAGASDRRSVIQSTGVSDPIDIALVETEWQRRIGPNATGAAGQHGNVVAGGGAVRPIVPRSVLSAPESLAQAPEEVQDAVIASELVGALVGRGGSYFVKTGASFTLSSAVPHALRAAAQSAIPAAEAFLSLAAAAEMELTAQSSVGMALGEVISETCCAYVQEVGKIEAGLSRRPMPLMRVLAEAQRVGYPIQRLGVVVAEMRRRWEGHVNGGRLLHFLHMQLAQAAGSEEDRHLLSLLLRRAALPYLAILQHWMREGALRDPFGEFFVVENKWAAADADPSTAFSRRFLLKKEMVPGFVNKDRLAKMAFVAGQYRCLVREATGALPAVAGPAQEVLVWTDAEDLQRTVQRYYEGACSAIISLLFDAKHDLVGRLASMKKYFLHAKGDWLVDFLDTADELLRKSPRHVKAHSVRVLLQAAVAKSSPNDPYHTDVGCTFSEESLDAAMHADGSATAAGGPAAASAPVNVSMAKVDTRRCIELLQLEVSYGWPLTLVITPQVVRHFNCIFRLLMWLKVAERSLHAAWSLKAERPSPLAASLKQQMIHFLRQFQFYASHFVLDRLWARLMARLPQADSVFAISQALETFFVSVDQELVLSSPSRFRSLARILDGMHQFAQLGFQRSALFTAAQMHKAVQRTGEDFWQALGELASPHGPDYPHLVPLLTWIDFSRYYEVRNIYRVTHGAVAATEVEALNFTVSSTGGAGGSALPSARGPSSSSLPPEPAVTTTRKVLPASARAAAARGHVAQAAYTAPAQEVDEGGDDTAE